MSAEKWFHGICKQVNHGDLIVIREKPVNGPPPSKVVGISNISCPRLQFRSQNPSYQVIQDEKFAWEAREFLRRRIVGQEVIYTEVKMPKGGIFGNVFIGTSSTIENNVAYIMVINGYAEVRKFSNQELAKDKWYQQLLEAEMSAKSQMIGRWDQESKVIGRSVCWNLQDPAQFLKNMSSKEQDAVVEFVRDGCSMQVCLVPSENDVNRVFYPITILLLGIKCPGFKNENNQLVPEKFAEEAKFFVESRLLQRDVKVRLISIAGGQNFLANLIHPRGDICEFLLEEGLAHVLEWGLDNLSLSSSILYRQKEQLAKEKRKNIWINYKAPSPPTEAQLKAIKQKTALSGKEFSGVIVEVGLGDNVTVKCDNGSIRKLYLSSLRPVRLNMEGQNEDGEVVQKVKINKPLYEIPYMFEAREFLRKNIGKHVNVHIDYSLPKPEGTNLEDRVCATVEVVGGRNLAEGLISRGLAQVVRYRRQGNDPRAKNYEALVLAEEEASSKMLGWHSKSKASPHKITEITGNASKAILPTYQRAGKIHGVVEFVASASRLKVFLPQYNSVITLLLAGINCAKTGRTLPNGKTEDGDPLGKEAAEFTKECCLQRNVEIELDGLDRVGNFIGYVHIHQYFGVQGNLKSGDNQIKVLQGNGKVVSKLLNVVLVLQGFATATLMGRNARSVYMPTLTKAQIEAQSAKKGIWSNEDFLKNWKEEQNNNEPEFSHNDGADFPSLDGLQNVITSTGKNHDSNNAKMKNILKNKINKAKRAHLMQASIGESSTDTGVRVYLQLNEDSSIMADIQSDLNNKPLSIAECESFKPERNKLCAAKFSVDKQWYRAIITSMTSSTLTVLFIDYGNSEEIDLKNCKDFLGPLSSKLATLPMISKPYRISGICMPPDLDDKYEVIDALMNIVGESAEVLMFCESPTPVPSNKDDKKPVPLVNLFVPRNAGAQTSEIACQPPDDIAEILLKKGLVYMDSSKISQEQRNRYEGCQNDAKKARLNIWRHGDCRPDD